MNHHIGSVLLFSGEINQSTFSVCWHFNPVSFHTLSPAFFFFNEPQDKNDLENSQMSTGSFKAKCMIKMTVELTEQSDIPF